MSDSQSLDKIDRMLLKLLQENARYSLKQLSEKVYLSSPAVAARIEKLEKQGIISGYHADINLNKMGYHSTAYVSLQMSPKQKQKAIPIIAAMPNVIECCVVSGNNSMIIKVGFPSNAELDSFIGQMQKFGPTQTEIVLSTPVPHRVIFAPDEVPEEETEE